MAEHSGPLVGLKVLEIAGGAGPEVGDRFARLGAEVLRLEPKGGPARAPGDPTLQSRRVVMLDLDRPAGAEACLRLLERADVLLDGLGPGGLERLDLAPEIALARKPALVCVRLGGGPAEADGLAFAALAALMRVRDTGQGQVVAFAAGTGGPDFSLTPGAAQPAAPDADGRQTLSDWGLGPAEIKALGLA